MKVYESACAGPDALPHPESRVVFWHRNLPPVDATTVGEHVLEATSSPVHGTLARRDELWRRCYDDLMAHAETRLNQEIARLHGRYAHVLQESIDSRHNDATGDSWLHGTFRFALMR